MLLNEKNLIHGQATATISNLVHGFLKRTIVYLRLDMVRRTRIVKKIVLGRQGVFQVVVFKFIFLLNHERYNHEISTADAETSSQEVYGLKQIFLQHVTVIDSITRIHFLDLLLRFLKFKENFVNLRLMLHLVTDGFFDICNLG